MRPPFWKMAAPREKTDGTPAGSVLHSSNPGTGSCRVHHTQATGLQGLPQKYCSAQAPGLSDLSRHLRTAVLCSALHRADKVRLRRSCGVKTRRGRYIGGLSTALQNAVDKPLMTDYFESYFSIASSIPSVPCLILNFYLVNSANIFRSALQIIEGTCTDNRHYSITEIQFKTDTRRNESPARKLTNYEEKGRHERWMITIALDIRTGHSDFLPGQNTVIVSCHAAHLYIHHGAGESRYVFLDSGVLCCNFDMCSRSQRGIQHPHRQCVWCNRTFPHETLTVINIR
ncbi:unnamed protein product [Ranitomeya imitator]|uniref:Uncharacterized protein n=1 Tax=Ranitomeya imitator TaxID=111125 RepID=A0ABN9L5M5_9NEOB|nr:unnamed protein product [Ranitomeya imitator]